ncbi:MAG: response regulator [Chthonomonadales bacterium]
MKVNAKNLTILIAEDDADDRILLLDALKECGIEHEIVFVDDGEHLLEYLKHEGKYTDIRLAPRPSLILLDLNMPKIDGREALKEIKSTTRLKSIPVIVLTTSRAQDDIVRSYDLGANAYMTKPTAFDELIATIASLKRFWIETAELPGDRHD